LLSLEALPGSIDFLQSFLGLAAKPSIVREPVGMPDLYEISIGLLRLGKGRRRQAQDPVVVGRGVDHSVTISDKYRIDLSRLSR
jgi:hypothetical protein